VPAPTGPPPAWQPPTPRQDPTGEPVRGSARDQLS